MTMEVSRASVPLGGKTLKLSLKERAGGIPLEREAPTPARVCAPAIPAAAQPAKPMPSGPGELVLPFFAAL